MSSLNSAENKQSPQDPGLELFRLSESLLGPDRKKVEVVSGEPSTEGDHFDIHLSILPDWDDETSERTDGVRIQVISDRYRDRNPVTMPQFRINPDGSSVSQRYRVIHGNIYEDRQPTPSVELMELLDSIHGGRVIDPKTEIVIDRSSETEPKLPPMKRVYKKKSIKRFGRSITDKARDFVIAS